MPYKPETRQYRSFAASNFKPVAQERQLDENGNDITPNEPTYKVRGYYTTFDTPYELYPAMPSMNFPAEYEQVDRHAFDNCDMSDVLFQFNHAGMVLARQKNGTLVLGFDDHGAWCEAYLGGCQQGRDLFEAISNGLIDEMSFGFVIADDEDGVGYTSTRDEHGDYHTTITRISRLYDVSAVDRPANDTTEIGELRKRSYLAATIEADRKAAEEQERLEQERIEAEKALMERIEAQRSLRKRRARALQLI